MQRQLYKHVVLDRILERKNIRNAKVARNKHMEARLKHLKAQADIDKMVRKMERKSYESDNLIVYTAPLNDQPLLYRIWVHFKRLFIGENS